jgi:hypothetical protein
MFILINAFNNSINLSFYIMDGYEAVVSVFGEGRMVGRNLCGSGRNLKKFKELEKLN